MLDDDSEVLCNPNDKKAVIERFWSKIVRKYYEEEVCEVDAKDVSNP